MSAAAALAYSARWASELKHKTNLLYILLHACLH